MKQTMKTTLYLFLRVVLVCILAAMAIPVTNIGDFMIPILAVFYFIILLYFFIFTTWSVGGKDVIANNRTGNKPFLAKGFVASGLVGVLLALIYFLPNIVDSLGGQGTVYLVFYFIKLAFSQIASFAMVWGQSIVTGVPLSSTDFAEAANGQAGAVAATIVFFAIILCCIIGAGVGYIVGYKQIKIIQPWLDKWKRN